MSKTNAEKRMQKIYKDQYKAFNEKVAEVSKIVTPRTFSRADESVPRPVKFIEKGVEQFVEKDAATSSNEKDAATSSKTQEDDK